MGNYVLPRRDGQWGGLFSHTWYNTRSHTELERDRGGGGREGMHVWLLMKKLSTVLLYWGKPVVGVPSIWCNWTNHYSPTPPPLPPEEVGHVSTNMHTLSIDYYTIAHPCNPAQSAKSVHHNYTVCGILNLISQKIPLYPSLCLSSSPLPSPLLSLSLSGLSVCNI